jgi:hypothetical protein
MVAHGLTPVASGVRVDDELGSMVVFGLGDRR